MSIKEFKTIIIGAGASGLMAANLLNSKDAAIIEANAKPAQKIKISGGGKCNITNKILSFDNYLGDKSFVKEVLDHFNQYDLLNFLKQRGLNPIIKKDTQYFCKNSSVELIDLLLKDLVTPIFYNQKVKSVKKQGSYFIIDDKFSAKHLIIATGGLSFESIGASDLAFRVAKDFGHTINKTSPALVGFTLQPDQFWMKELSGISIDVGIKVKDKKLRGDMLFAHRGISGPVILNASLYWQKGVIEIDFVPHIKFNESFFRSAKLISTALKVPKRFAKALLRSIGLEDLPLDRLDLASKEKLKSIKSYTFAPAGNFGYTKAEATKGGIFTDEIDAKTMMSKKCKNLYFIGECLDVTGELGGYNFQWAFASATKLTLQQ